MNDNDKITIHAGDDARIPVVLFTHQDEGHYQYFPEQGCTLNFILIDEDGTVAQEKTFTFDSTTKGIEIVMDHTLSAGEYLYSLYLINPDGERNTICDKRRLIIK